MEKNIEFQRNDQKPIELITLRNFILLNFITFGIYGIWWIYKAWLFFKEKDDLDILPAARAIFAIFSCTIYLTKSKILLNQKVMIKSFLP